MFKLKRLTVHKCRSVRPGTELTFNDGLNIVLGKNGTGKTTLLKLIAAAVGSNFNDEFREDEIHVEYESDLGGCHVHCEFRRQDVGISDALPTTRLRSPTFRATFSAPDITPVSIKLGGDKIAVSSAAFSDESVINSSVFTSPYLDLMFLAGAFVSTTDAPAELRHVVGLPVPRFTHRLDEGLDWLRRTLDNLTVSFTRDDQGDSGFVSDTQFPGLASAFREALREYQNHFESLPDLLTIHSDRLPFLRLACEHLGLRYASWTLSFIETTRAASPTKRYGRSQVYVTTRGGTRFPLEKLSFGQLRLFAFFLHSAMHPDVVVADELTNGLHHAMVESCLDTIGERQAFLATQNPLLLDHVGFDDAEEVRRTFVLCDLQDAPDGEGTMVWRNMEAAEAHEFFADYKVGVQHTNDILRKRGLW